MEGFWFCPKAKRAAGSGTDGRTHESKCERKIFAGRGTMSTYYYGGTVVESRTGTIELEVLVGDRHFIEKYLVSMSIILCRFQNTKGDAQYSEVACRGAAAPTFGPFAPAISI